MIWGMIYCLLKFQTKYSLHLNGSGFRLVATIAMKFAQIGAVISHIWGATWGNTFEPEKSSRKFVHLSFLMWFEQFDQPMAMKERRTANESCPIGSIYGIFTQIWLIYGKCNIPYMDPMGFECGNFHFFKRWPASPKFLG